MPPRQRDATRSAAVRTEGCGSMRTREARYPRADKCPTNADECPASWWEALFWSPTLSLSLTWPLVCTSLSWYAVSWYAVSCARQVNNDAVLWCLAAILLSTATASTLHWLRAHSGWRCAVDKLIARASFAVFTVVALTRIRDVRLCLFGWPLWAVMVTCYRASRRYWESDGPTRARWVVAHACFHCCVGVGQCMILHGATHASPRLTFSR